jgi:6-phosphofructokinase 1
MARKKTATRRRRIATIGVLTSGGDAPGMNAAVRAVVRVGCGRGLRVYGIRRGYQGVLQDHMDLMDERSVGNIVQRGGSILGSSRSDEFKRASGLKKACAVLARRSLDGLLLIGGDGTMRGGRALMAKGGPPCIGIPATIDNDIAGTDRTIGFDTAINTALEAMDKIRDTANTVELLHFVEVMGRGSGWIAMMTGLGGGAEAIVIPERPTDIADLCRRIRESLAAGKRGVIIVVAEGGYEGGATALADAVHRRLDLENRVTILGHVQRGGSPSAADRVLGSRLGAAAVEAVLAGAAGVMIGEHERRIATTPLARVVGRRHKLDTQLIRLIEQIA